MSKLAFKEITFDISEERRTTTLTSSGYSGGMSLHELNNRLERYIQQIQLNPNDPHVSITMDRIQDGTNFNINDLPQYHEYERLVS